MTSFKSGEQILEERKKQFNSKTKFMSGEEILYSRGKPNPIEYQEMEATLLRKNKPKINVMPSQVTPVIKNQSMPVASSMDMPSIKSPIIKPPISKYIKPVPFNSKPENEAVIKQWNPTVWDKFKGFLGNVGDKVKSFAYGLGDAAGGKALNTIDSKIMKKSNGGRFPEGYSKEGDVENYFADNYNALKNSGYSDKDIETLKKQQLKLAKAQDNANARRYFKNENLQWKPTKADQYTEIAGNVAGEVVKMLGVGKVAGVFAGGVSNPLVQKIVARTLTGVGLGGIKSLENNSDVGDTFKNIGRETLFMNAGGAASDIVGGVSGSILKNTALRNSVAAEIARQGLKGAAFGAAGTASTIPTYSKEERPDNQDIISSAVAGALFEMLPGVFNTIKTSKVNKQILDSGLKDFVNQNYGSYQEARAIRAENPNGAIERYNQVINNVDDTIKALQKNRFVGQDKRVNEIIDMMEALKDRVNYERSMVINTNKGSGNILNAENPIPKADYSLPQLMANNEAVNAPETVPSGQAINIPPARENINSGLVGAANEELNTENKPVIPQNNVATPEEKQIYAAKLKEIAGEGGSEEDAVNKLLYTKGKYTFGELKKINELISNSSLDSKSEVNDIYKKIIGGRATSFSKQKSDIINFAADVSRDVEFLDRHYNYFGMGNEGVNVKEAAADATHASTDIPPMAINVRNGVNNASSTMEDKPSAWTDADTNVSPQSYVQNTSSLTSSSNDIISSDKNVNNMEIAPNTENPVAIDTNNKSEKELEDVSIKLSSQAQKLIPYLDDVENFIVSKGNRDNKKHGLDAYQRTFLAEHLIEGLKTNHNEIFVDIPKDGKFTVVNNPKVVAYLMNELGFKSKEVESSNHKVSNKKEDINIRVRENGSEVMTPVQGRKVTIPGFEDLQLYVHKAYRDPKHYVVTEATTGLALSSKVRSSEAAIKEVRQLFDKFKSEGKDIRAIIKDNYKKLNPEKEKTKISENEKTVNDVNSVAESKNIVNESVDKDSKAEKTSRNKIDSEDVLRDISKFNSNLAKGVDLTFNEVVKMATYMIENEDAITAALSNLKNDELKKMISPLVRSNYTKKADMVKKIYHDQLMHTRYYLTGDNSISYVLGGKESTTDLYKRKLKEAIEGMDEAKFKEVLAENKKSYEGAIEERKRRMQGVKVPVTLEDFENARRVRKLSPEEQDTYEDLKARDKKKNREQRKEQDAERKQNNAVNAISQTAEYTIEKSKHTKTGKDIWIVRPKERLSSEDFKTVKAAMTNLKAYYSSFKGINGFVFDYDPTEVLGGEAAAGELLQQREPEKKNYEKVRELASKPDISESVKKTLNNIADAMEKGEIELIDKLQYMTEITEFENLLRMGQFKRMKEEKIPFEYTKEGRLIEKPYNIEDIRYIDYPVEEVYVDSLNRLIKDANGKKGTVLISKRFEKLIDGKQDDDKVAIPNRMIDDLKKLIKATGNESMYLNDILQRRMRLERLGIEDIGDLRAYLREYFKYREGAKLKTKEELEREERIEALKKAKIPGYFPTPKNIVNRMLDLADIQEGDKVLEPSAGTGHIADEIGPGKVDVAEWNNSLREVLRDKGHNVIGEDALQVKGKYDKIVMNPPFEKNQDIKHVMYAYENNLKKGGRLVAIMSEHPFFANDKESVAFREWLENVGGISEKLPEGSFMESDRKTGVNTRIVVIEKEDKSSQNSSYPAFNKDDVLKKKVRIITANAENMLDIKDFDNPVKKVKRHSLDNIRGKYPNEDQGIDIYINAVGIKETLNKFSSDEKLNTMPLLPELLKYAVKYREEDDTKGRSIKKWHYFVGGFTYKGEPYRALIDVREIGDQHQFYLHKIGIIKVPVDNQAAYKKLVSDSAKSQSTFTLSVKQLLENVNAEDENAFTSYEKGGPSIGKATGQNTSGEAKRASEIFKEFGKKLDVAIKRKRSGRDLGTFNNHTYIIRIKKANDIPVLSHEVGHLLDREYVLSNTLNQAVRAELMSLGDATSKPSYSAATVRKEGIAEFVRLYLTDADNLQIKAPATLKHFEGKVPEEVLKVLKDFRKDIWNLTNLDPVERIRKSIHFKGDKVNKNPINLMDTLRKIYTGMIDMTYPVEYSAGQIAGKKAQTKVANMLSRFRGYEGISLHDVFDAQTNLDGKTVGDSLQKILGPVLKDEKTRQDFVIYQLARRSKDYFERELELPDTEETYEAAIPKLEAKYPEFKSIFDKLLTYRQNSTHLLVEAGIYSKDDFKGMVIGNPNYTPLKRIIEALNNKPGSGRSLSGAKKVVKKVVGGGEEIIDPMESDINNTFIYRSAAIRNQILVQLADYADRAENKGYIMAKAERKIKPTDFNLEQIKKTLEDQGIDTTGIDLNVTARIWNPNYLAGPNQVVIYRKGEPELYDIHPELYAAVKHLTPEMGGAIVKALTSIANVQKTGIIFTPKYIVYNTGRDTLHNLISSEVGINLLDIFSGFYSAIRKDEYYKLAKAMGGTVNHFSANDRKFAQEAIDDMMAGMSKAKRFWRRVRHPLVTIQDMIEPSEMGGRIAEFKKHLKKLGHSDAEIEQAITDMRRLSIDFRRMGAWIKKAQLNRMTNFLNSNLQGMDNVVSLLYKHPIRTILRGLLYITLPTLFLMWVNKDNEYYKKDLNWFRKDFFFNIPIGDPRTTHIFLPIPRPWEMGLLFGALPERLITKLREDDPHAFDEFMISVEQTIVPEFMPSAAQPVFEDAIGLDWRGRPLLSESDKRVSPELQYNEYTSETSKAITNVTKNLPVPEALKSPKRLDHLIRGYTGTLGSIALDSIDQAAGEKEGIPVIGGLTNNFIADAYRNPQSVNVFYKYKSILDTEYSDSKRLKQDMPAKDAALRQVFNQCENTISQLNDLKQAIEKSNKYNESEKQLQITAANAKIIELARKANDLYDRNK